jgi:hypothetical protein
MGSAFNGVSALECVLVGSLYVRKSLILVIHPDVRYDHRQRIKRRSPRMNAWA